MSAMARQIDEGATDVDEAKHPLILHNQIGGLEVAVDDTTMVNVLHR